MLTNLQILSPGHVEITHSWVAVGLTISITIIALTAGVWLLSRKNWKFGFPCLGVGFITGLFVVPGTFSDKVRVTPSSVWQSTGYSFAPIIESLKLKAGDKVSIDTVEKTRSRGRTEDVLVLVAELKDGTRKTIYPSRLLSSHFSEMTDCLKLGGFSVVDRRETAEQIYGQEELKRPGN